MKKSLYAMLCVAIATILASCNSKSVTEIKTITVEPQDTVVKLSDIFDLCYVIPLKCNARQVDKAIIANDMCLFLEESSNTLRLVDGRTGKEMNTLTLKPEKEEDVQLIDFWYSLDNPDSIVDVLVRISGANAHSNKKEIRCYKLPDFTECGRLELNKMKVGPVEALCRVNASDYLLGNSWWSNDHLRLKRWDATLNALKDEYISPQPITFATENTVYDIIRTRNMFSLSGRFYVMSQTYDPMIYLLNDKGIPSDSVLLDFGDREIKNQSEVYPFGGSWSLEPEDAPNREVHSSFCMLFDYQCDGQRYMAITDGDSASQSFTHIFDDLVLNETLLVEAFRPVNADITQMIISVTGKTVREVIDNKGITIGDSEMQHQLNVVGADDNLLIVLKTK